MLSAMGVQVIPASEDLKTPPPAAPTYTMSVFVGSKSMDSIRPAKFVGPSENHELRGPGPIASSISRFCSQALHRAPGSGSRPSSIRRVWNHLKRL